MSTADDPLGRPGMAFSGDATPSSLPPGRPRGRRDRRLTGARGERRRLHVHQARGRRHDQAELQEAGHGAGQEPAIRDRDDDQLRGDSHRPRPQARRPHPQLDRLPRHEALLRRAHIPARRPGLRAAGRRSPRRRHGRAGLRGRRGIAQVVSLQARRRRNGQDGQRALGLGRLAVLRHLRLRRPATAAGLRLCSAMRPTRPRLPRSGASRRSPRRPAATRRGVLPRRRSGSPALGSSLCPSWGVERWRRGASRDR